MGDDVEEKGNGDAYERGRREGKAEGREIGALQQSVKALCGSVDDLRGEVRALRANVATKDDITGFYEHCHACKQELKAADAANHEAADAGAESMAEISAVKKLAAWAAPYIVPGAISALTALVVILVSS